MNRTPDHVSPPPKIVFFDVDHTLFRPSSTEALLLRWLMRHGKIPWSNLVRSCIFLLAHLDDFAGTAVRQNKYYLKGLPIAWLERVARDLIRRELPRSLSPAGLAEIRQLRERGHRVVLLSASLAILIRALQPPVAADDVIATELEVAGGRCTGQVAGLHPYAERKRLVAEHYLNQRGLGWSQSQAYGNAASDLPLLRSVGWPVVVNPSRALRRVADQSGWPIKTF